MAALLATFNDFYAAADAVIKPAVFGAIKSLGWKLVPSASRPRRPLRPGAAQLEAQPRPRQPAALPEVGRARALTPSALAQRR